MRLAEIWDPQPRNVTCTRQAVHVYMHMRHWFFPERRSETLCCLPVTDEPKSAKIDSIFTLSGQGCIVCMLACISEARSAVYISLHKAQPRWFLSGRVSIRVYPGVYIVLCARLCVTQTNCDFDQGRTAVVCTDTRAQTQQLSLLLTCLTV